MRPVQIILLLVSSVACETTTDRPCSENGAGITGTIVGNPTLTPLSSDLAVRGTLQHPADVTVLKVLVGGIPATKESGDFDTFTANVPFATVQGLAFAQNDPAAATVDAIAILDCGSSSSGHDGRPSDPTKFATLSVPLVQKAVTRLAFADPAPLAGYIPAAKSVAARLLLTANPEAAGAIVSVSTTVGTLSGLSSGAVLLLGDGEHDAQAEIFLSGDASKEGTARVVATAAITFAEISVKIAGPPAFLPATAQLVPGTSLNLEVVTSGTLKGCTASPGAGLTITSGPTDLTAASTVADTNGDGFADISVAVSSGAAAPAATTTISCVDVYGQAVTASFAVKG